MEEQEREREEEGGNLFDVSSYSRAVKDIKEVKSFVGTGHGLQLHLHRHVCVLDYCPSFQHSALSLVVSTFYFSIASELIQIEGCFGCELSLSLSPELISAI